MKIGNIISIKSKDGLKKGTITFIWDNRDTYNIQYTDGKIEEKKKFYQLDNDKKLFTMEIDIYMKSFSNYTVPLKEYKCSECDFIFNYKIELNNHKWDKHTLSKYKLNKNRCYDCGKLYNNKRDLERHSWESHPKNDIETSWANTDWDTWTGSSYYADDPYY
tara:strand:+ start:87 stop:572 length:486 start_codon:yes stop_codon:yes gene_type:complete